MITKVYNELLKRGFDVNLLEMFYTISHQDSYQTTIQFLADDEESYNRAKIASTRIELNNNLSPVEKLFICNYFNKNTPYCSACLSDDENEYFMVYTYVPIKCKNFVEICADMFEEVIGATDYLVDLINHN